MLRRSVILAVLTAVGAAGLSGCDTDVSQDDDVEPRESVVRPGLVSLYTLEGAGPDGSDPALAAEAECFADALLERLSLDELVQAGVVEDDGTVTAAVPMLDVDVAAAWVDAQSSCVDYAVVSARAVTGPGGRPVDPEAYAACLEAALDDAAVEQALVRALSGGINSAEVAALTRAQTECAAGVPPG